MVPNGCQILRPTLWFQMQMQTIKKERPIRLYQNEVRGILGERQTQLRRVLKPQPSSINGVGFFEPTKLDRIGIEYPGESVFGCWNDEVGWKYPFGSPGDRLWVRETWTPDHKDFYPHFPVCYRADFGPEYLREYGKVWSSEQNAWFPWRWRPSIQMPRWVSRITLEITGVRVERLNDISEEDAIAEGIEVTLKMPDDHQDGYRDYSVSKLVGTCVLPKCSFQTLWETINGEESWALNPWVWVLKFKVV